MINLCCYKLHWEREASQCGKTRRADRCRANDKLTVKNPRKGSRTEKSRGSDGQRFYLLGSFCDDSACFDSESSQCGKWAIMAHRGPSRQSVGCNHRLQPRLIFPASTTRFGILFTTPINGFILILAPPNRNLKLAFIV